MVRQHALRFILLLSGLARVVPAQIPSIADFGFCAYSGLMADFNSTAYAGDWFTVMGVPNTFSLIRHCDVMTVRPAANGSYSVLNRGLDDSLQPLQQTATLQRGGGQGQEPYFMLDSSEAPAVSYDIVATDYHTYSCVYTCLSIAALRVELFWILSKEVNSSEAAKSHCLQVFEEMEVDTTKLREVRQGEDYCNEVGTRKEQDPETEAVSMVGETRRFAEGRSRVALTEGVQILTDLPFTTKEPTTPSSRSTEHPTNDIASLKIESYLKQRGSSHLLSDEEMEDEEYFVLDEDYVNINSGHKLTIALRVLGITAGLLVFTASSSLF